MDSELQNAIAAIRVSSTKQGLIGDSPDQQKKLIEFYAKTHNLKIVEWFVFMQSASGEIQPSQQAIEFLKNHPEKKSKFMIFKSIDRFTRAGAYFYGDLKRQLSKYGVQPVDCHGIIGTQKINTLESYGVKYTWSEYSPTDKTELLAAEDAKDDIRRILSQMIGAEIDYVRKGYAVRSAQMGYKNEKVETPHGKRVIKVPDPIESPWFVRMFELRAEGIKSDEEIVKEINEMGFKSRTTKLRSKLDRTKVIGFKGGKKLTVKQFQSYIQNPIYAGVNDEKWTNDKPVKTKFPGLVSTELFNKANKGKITILIDENEVKIIKTKLLEFRLRKNKNNPNFPYKAYIACPKCKTVLYGSAPRNKNGRHIPRYHCSRKHPYWSINANELEKIVSEFLDKIKFKKELLEDFKRIVLEEWQKRRSDAAKQSLYHQEKVSELETEKVMLLEKLKVLTSPTAIKYVEEELEKVEQSKALAISERDNKEDEELDLEVVISNIIYYLEHLGEIIKSEPDPLKKAGYFGVLFETIPTFEELSFGTPRLAPSVELNLNVATTQELSARPEGFEPST